MPHSAHESSGHEALSSDRREHSPPPTARDHVRSAVRREALSEADDEVPRGAIFLFISAKAMATIEFLQQEWINDGNFIGIGGERDPIIGLQEEGASFTIPKEPVRRRVHGIETFNVLRGGEYFFMPSLSALRWLGELG